MSNQKKLSIKSLVPVLLGFYVMGFIDIVSAATGYAEKEYTDVPSWAIQLIPSMAFIWFFLLSVPVGVLLNKYGKKVITNVGIIIGAVGLVLPLIPGSFGILLAGFMLLGVGNTIIQVSLNPLLFDVVPTSKYPSFMSLSQFIKAICSLLGPIIMIFCVAQFGNWKLVFLLYAALSILSAIWLYFTPIEESKPAENKASIGSCLKLLGNPFVLMMVMGIFLIVGAEVGLNSNMQSYIQTTFGVPIEEATMLISYYFATLMIGRFAGALILNWIRPRIFLVITATLMLVSLLTFIYAASFGLAKIAILAAGLGSANIFPLIFSITVEKMPDRVNDLSGLMIMAVAGGAIIPPVIGLVRDSSGLTAGMLVTALCLAYITLVSVILVLKRAK